MKEKLLEFKTHLEGVRIKAKKIVYLPPTKLEKFYSIAKQFAGLVFQRKEFEKKEDELREEIIRIAQEHEIEGIICEKDKFLITIFPREKVSWNREILKKILGALYYNFVEEELKVTIRLPILREREVISTEKILKVIKEALMKEFNLSKEEISKVILEEINVNEVAEEKLEKTLFSNKISEAKEAKISWVVRVSSC